jgi:hypothetical protein
VPPQPSMELKPFHLAWNMSFSTTIKKLLLS